MSMPYKPRLRFKVQLQDIATWTGIFGAIAAIVGTLIAAIPLLPSASTHKDAPAIISPTSAATASNVSSHEIPPEGRPSENDAETITRSGDANAAQGTRTTAESGTLSLNGTYVGALKDFKAGFGTMRLVLKQSNGSMLTGSIKDTFGSSSANFTGNLVGTINDSDIDFDITATDDSYCGYNVHGTLSRNTIAGRYRSKNNCPMDDSGSFSVTQQ